MKTLTIAVALMLAAGPAWSGHDRDDEGAPRAIDERRPLKMDGRLTLENTAGPIEIQAWDKAEVWLTGELGAEVEKLEITGSDTSLRIKVRLPDDEHHVSDTHLMLKVPAGASLDVQGVSSDISVQGVKGDATIESVSGDVRLKLGSKKVKAQSVSGDVTVDAPSTEARVQSVSGDVTVRGARGEIRAESVSGDVDVTASDVTHLDLESVSGDHHVQVDLAREAQVSIETLSGEIALALPKLPEGEIDMETFSGSLLSAWSPGPRKDDKDWSREGEGKGRVRLHSFSGDVELRKR
ncbi:MAG TPA: DUF4097 family beta strand repeat-containing protein [Verrucomicrobiae bacterium]|nr:DUF4097 family beta strand repeat-containing protein [Verrucomicrobiae bacterium]